MSTCIPLPVSNVFNSKTIKSAVYDFVTDYETPKIVTIRSAKFTLLLRISQVIILLYGVLYLLLYQKGYQKQDSSIVSSVTLKVKGIGYVESLKNQTTIIDGTDYVIPPLENAAVFIMSCYIRTEQKRMTCEESKYIDNAHCTRNEQCVANNYQFLHTNGRWTGRCLIRLNQTVGLCEIEGWCPVEDDLAQRELIEGVLNFTIFLKNFVEFPGFKVIRKNFHDNMSPCLYHDIHDKSCPIFRLSTIIESAETDQAERELMLKFGGVIKIKLNWDCNFDFNVKKCVPVYSFGRLDAKFKAENFSKGFNFRFASYWKNLNESHRTLTKSFGLRFIISVSGTGGKFDIITLTLNIGSIIGIFGLASVLSDIVVLHLCRNAHVYKQHIVERVDRNTIRKDIQYSLQAKTEQNIRIDLYSKEHTASLTNESRIGRTRSPSIIRPLVVINTVKTHSSKDDQLPVRTQV